MARDSVDDFLVDINEKDFEEDEPSEEKLSSQSPTSPASPASVSLPELQEDTVENDTKDAEDSRPLSESVVKEDTDGDEIASELILEQGDVEEKELNQLSSRSQQKLATKYDISHFKYSLNEPLKSHIYAADSAINFINEAKLDWDQQKIFETHRKDIIGNFETIIHIHDKYYFALSEKNLQKEAEKEYYSYFEGVKNNNKIQFLQLKYTYQILSSFNLQVFKYWDSSRKMLLDLENHSEIRKFVRELMELKIETMLLLCDQTNELLARIKMIFGDFNEEVDSYSYDVIINPVYTDGRNYSIKQCFQGNIADDRVKELLGQMNRPQQTIVTNEDTEQKKREDLAELFVRKKKERGIDKSKLGSIKNFSLDRVEQSMEKTGQHKKADGLVREKFDDKIHLQLIGKKTWNQTKFYQLSISKGKLQETLDRIKEAVYFSDQTNLSDEKSIRKKVVIGVARKNRINILKDLQNFLLNQIDIAVDELVRSFSIPLESKNLFVFHFGAKQMAEMQRRYLLATKMGFCFIAEFHKGETRITKEFFPELVDDSVIKYWQSRINPTYDDSFNNFWDYSRIADLVRNRYQHALEIHRRKLDSIFGKLKNNNTTKAQKEKYFQNHFIDWFGFREIFVYKRFVDRSVFTNWQGGSSKPVFINSSQDIDSSK